MKKKRTVATASTAVTELLEAFGNRRLKKSRPPKRTTRSKLNHTSSTELIRFDSGKGELKKSRRIREEFIKIRCAALKTLVRPKSE